MKSSTKALIEQRRRPGDAVYELLRNPKRLFIFQIWDTLFDLIPSKTDSLQNDKAVFLLASIKYGRIIEIEDNKIVNEIFIPNWISDMKSKFKKTTINNCVYKKYRKIS